jgi:hypothetical protein
MSFWIKREKNLVFSITVVARFWDFQMTYRLFLSQATRTDNTSFISLICFFLKKGHGLACSRAGLFLIGQGYRPGLPHLAIIDLIASSFSKLLFFI